MRLIPVVSHLMWVGLVGVKSVAEDGSSQTDEAEGEKREEEESSMQENVNSLSLCKPQQTPPPVNTRSEPRLHSIPGEAVSVSYQ